MEQLYRVRVPFRGVCLSGPVKQIVYLPNGATVRLATGGRGGKWATVEWNGVQVRVFWQDLQQQTEPITLRRLP